jgi:hypothetical protein
MCLHDAPIYLYLFGIVVKAEAEKALLRFPRNVSFSPAIMMLQLAAYAKHVQQGRAVANVQ